MLRASRIEFRPYTAVDRGRVSCCSAGAADEPAGRGDVGDVDPADVGRAAGARRRNAAGRRLVRALLQRLAPAPERPRHHLAARQLVPARRPHARHRLPRPRVGPVGGARRERQHAHHTSPHTRLRYSYSRRSELLLFGRFLVCTN